MDYYGESNCIKCGKILKAEANGRGMPIDYKLYEDEVIDFNFDDYNNRYKITCRCSKCGTENKIIAK